MTSTTLQKQATQLEKLIKKASRALLEFEVAQSKWEREHGYFKIYKSAAAVMREMRRKTR